MDKPVSTTEGVAWMSLTPYPNSRVDKRFETTSVVEISLQTGQFDSKMVDVTVPLEVDET
jgi:hypothetical protein